ncbi:putative holin-like toxin [Oceanobacillus sp. CAU 1775]
MGGGSLSFFFIGKEATSMTVFQSIYLMLVFGALIIAIMSNKKK